MPLLPCPPPVTRLAPEIRAAAGNGGGSDRAKVARRIVDLLTLAAASGQPSTAAFEPPPRALCARLDGFFLDARGPDPRE